MNLSRNFKTVAVSLCIGVTLGSVAFATAGGATEGDGGRVVGSDDIDRVRPVFEKNRLGLTVGSLAGVFDEDAPDLIYAIGNSGNTGYILRSDLMEKLPSSPEEAVRSSVVRKLPRTLKLYDREGKDVIGSFTTG
jgi:hypothetical protein